MGEVYRGRDTKLHRDVAIKVLPELFAADPDRLARFDREAQALAALNHPNIAQVFGVLEAPPALAMELVEGEDLSQRIARGPIPVEEALPIARQIADALEAAHERGIIHRDLKPANIKVRDDGTVKVLDFGLAKAIDRPPEGSPHQLMNSPTFTSPAMTQMGVMLGTAAYMAPEQARGKALDKRADIWAFGVILLEMLTGRQLFSGETVSDVLAAVLREEIRVESLPDDVPRPVRRMLERCLEKDPRRRLRDIGDARLEIDAAIAGKEPAAASPASGVPGRRAIPWVAASLLVGALAGAVTVWLLPRHQASAPLRASTVRFEITPPASVTHVPNVALSPDASFLVYSGEGDAETSLYLHRFQTGESRLLTGTTGARWPFVSPDGKWVAFYRSSKLQKISLAGGDALTLCELNGGPGAVWLPDGGIVFSGSWLSGLSTVSQDGGVVTPLTTPNAAAGEKGHWWPAALPDGRLIFTIFMAGAGLNDNRLAVLDPKTRQYRVLFPGARGYWLPSGHILFYRAGRYQTVPFDLASLRATGDPSVILEDATDLDPGGDWPQPVSVAGNGALAYVPGRNVPPARIAWVAADGTRTLTSLPVRPYLNVALSPGDDQVALTALEEGRLSVRVVEFARGSDARLDVEGMAWNPVWHPDGRLSFTSMRKGDFDVFIKNLARPDPESPVLQDDMDSSPSAWTSDGRLVYQGSESDGRYVLKLVRPGTSEPAQRLTGGRTEPNASVSPDGKWLAFTASGERRTQVYVQPFPGPGSAVQVSPMGADNPVFRRGSRELYYRRGADLAIASWEERNGRFFVTSERFIRGIPWTLTTFSIPYSVAADGRVLAIVAAEPLKPPRLEIVLGWAEELKAK